MKTLLGIYVICFVVVAAAGAHAQPPPLTEWNKGLGDVPNSHLAFLFEVTFLSIDIADVEAFLSPETAKEIYPITTEIQNDESLNRLAEILLNSNDIAFRMTFLRDGGLSKIISGARNNFEAAYEVGLLTLDELESVWQEYFAVMSSLSSLSSMSSLAERGAREGDQLLYRAGENEVWMGYVDASGTELINIVHPGGAWARGIKGSFLAPDSRFQEGLLNSLWAEKDD